MATAKKPTAKKTAPKKTAAKTSARKKVSAPASKPKSSKPSVLHGSFTIQSEKDPFFTFRITDQTVYWSIFSIAVLLLGLWVLQLHLAVEEIYNTIDQNQAMYDLDMPTAAAPTKTIE